MKKFALPLLATLTLCSPLLAHAGGGIDLKQIIKDSVKSNGQTANAQTPNNSAAQMNSTKQVVDSNTVAALLSKIKVPDIVGISIGMQAANAKQILLKLNPAYRFEPLDSIYTMNQLKGFTATTAPRGTFNNPDTETVEVIYNEAGAVFAVRRTVYALSPAKRIPLDVFYNSVTEKYDAPGVNASQRFPGSLTQSWHYEMNGRQFVSGRGPGSDDPCLSGNEPSNRGFFFQFAPKPSCGVMITASGSPLRTDTNVLEGYHIAISAPWMLHDANVLAAAANAAASQRQAQEKLVKDNKPQL